MKELPIYQICIFIYYYYLFIYLFLFLKNQHLIMLLFQPTTIISPLEFMIV